MFGDKFKVLKALPRIFKKVGDNYPEYFVAYEDNGLLEYFIIDDNFGQPSPANTCNTPYSIKLRARSNDILIELERDGYIEVINEN